MEGALAANGYFHDKKGLILDQLYGAVLPFTFRKLSLTHSSVIVRVRNASSVNADFKAGFEDKEVEDFLGGSNGTCNIWYTGDTFAGLSQGTTANQALFSKSMNNRWALTFDGTNDRYTGASTIEYALQLTVFIVCNCTTGTAFQVSTNNNTIDKRFVLAFNAGKIVTRFYDASAGGYYADLQSVNTYSGNIIICIYNNNKTVKVEVNGVEIAMTTGPATGVAAPNAIFMGAASGAFNFLNGTLAELIAFQRALTYDERMLYVKDASEYFGI